MRRETLESYGGDLVAVCVATRDIEPGDTLDEGNVAVEEWVASLLPPDAVTSLADVAGKVATSRIPQRAVLCPAYVEARAGDLEVPDGCVAVSVASDAEHAVGGALAREVGSRGITVNCIAPGFIDTDMTKVLKDEQKTALLANIPLGRLGQTDDIANACVFLASDAGAYLTGTTLHVNGGMFMG